jgi:hypothetical protein
MARRRVQMDPVQRIAGLELNALYLAGTIAEEFDKVRVPAAGTPIHDINGAVLFHRLALARGKMALGYADIAADASLGEPLLAVSSGFVWDEKALLADAERAARKGRRGLKYDAVRFVAYSYPKVGVQYLLEGSEVLLLELLTWAEVPPATLEGRSEPKENERSTGPFPGNFERWSLIDETPVEIRRARARAHAKRIEVWSTPAFARLDVSLIRKDALRVADLVLKLVDTRELHYSGDLDDHHICYELRGQQTNVWCVGASAEMLLNFYRYRYDQVRLAQELGLGTLANPNGLPYARVGDVVTVLEALTSNALDVTMHVDPTFDIFRNEIRENRPLISFVPGHSRTVAGYTRSVFSFPIGYRGLLVYDPWPPNVGVITKWENVATQTYQYAYSAVLQHV